MTTYNSYEAAKIANPESEIVTTGKDWDGRSDLIGKFEAFVCEALGSHGLGNTSWVKCNPADHCMTVERFLKDGHKFVEGDRFFDIDGEVEKVGLTFTPLEANRPHENDNTRYILRAAALEEKEKPRKDIDVKSWKDKDGSTWISIGQAEWEVGDIATLTKHESFAAVEGVEDYYGENCKIIHLFTNSQMYQMATVEFEDGLCYCFVLPMLTKPETPTQKLEREELEAGEKLWRDFGYRNPKYPTFESLKLDYKKCWISYAKKLSEKGE